MNEIKYRVTSGPRILYEAPSVKRILTMVEQDRDHWSAVGLAEALHWVGTENATASYDALLGELASLSEETPQFDCQRKRHAAFLPPVTSGAGLLLTNLAMQGEKNSAAGVIAYWWWQNGWTSHSSTNLREFHDDRIDRSIIRHGAILVEAFSAAQMSSREPTELAKLSAQSETLNRLIAEQQERAADLDLRQVSLIATFERIREEMTKHLEEFQAQTSETALGEALRSDQLASDWAEKWNATHQHYHEQLRYEAPVKLWEGKAKAHRDAAKLAFKWFAGLAALTVVAAAVIVICFGEWIGASFTTMRCEYGGKCQEVFSFRGPLTIGGILIGASVLIWAMRFSSRIYLSERHLALGAEERKSFTQSYLAMKTDSNVTGEQEAIVMAALFRPSQDGIVRDDDQALDISVASILARAMAGQRGAS